MNLMRIGLKRTRLVDAYCARRWILALAGLDFGTERTLGLPLLMLAMDQSHYHLSGPSAPTRTTLRLLVGSRGDVEITVDRLV